MNSIPPGRRARGERPEAAVLQTGTANMTRAVASRRLALAGFVGTAVSFGPARMGFGLFLPAFRDDFALSATLAGLIASGGFTAFLIALPLAAWLAVHIGPRVAVIAGALFAATGLALVATATSIGMLAAGVAFAGASAGLCWTPFNDAVARVVAPEYRPATLSVVATGTTIGVAAAGALALVVTWEFLNWRAAWSIFALVGCLAALAAMLGMPSGRSGQARLHPPATAFWQPATWPLYAAALFFGVSNAAYLSFAADSVVNSGGLPGLPDEAAAAVIFVSYGVFGIIGLATGRMEARLGLRWLLSGVFSAFAVSLVLVAIAPGAWLGVIVSAGLHGAGVMVISALLSFWSLRLFPDNGSLGFTAALVVLAFGGVLGAALAGFLIDHVGMRPAFMLLAAPLAVAALMSAADGARGQS